MKLSKLEADSAWHISLGLGIMRLAPKPPHKWNKRKTHAKQINLQNDKRKYAENVKSSPQNENYNRRQVLPVQEASSHGMGLPGGWQAGRSTRVRNLASPSSPSETSQKRATATESMDEISLSTCYIIFAETIVSEELWELDVPVGHKVFRREQGRQWTQSNQGVSLSYKSGSRSRMWVTKEIQSAYMLVFIR